MNRGRRIAALLAVAGACALSAPATGQAAISTLSFKAEADTWVTSSSPTATFGTSGSMAIDSSPRKEAFLRFDVEGIDGRTIVGARLRGFQTNASNQGGRVWTISSNDWTESMTWNSKPPIDGSQLGQFGQVSAGNYYEADLGTPPLSDGPVSLAIDTPSSDDARWATREALATRAGHVKVPRLIIEVESGDSVIDGLSEVAGPKVGSSEPTYHGSQRRLAITELGRLLTVHGLHGTGLQLAWRDAAGNWQNQTTGTTSDGILLRDTGTGDWPASIAVARDSDGTEHAWVVTARVSTSKARPVYIRRLSDLDSPSGPTVGPLVEVASPTLGAFRPDIAFESAPNGDDRGLVLWQRRSGDSTSDTVAGWLTDLDSDTPNVQERVTIDSSSGLKRSGTIVPGPAGMHILIRPGTSPLALFTHLADAPLTDWTRSVNGMPVSSSASPTAVGLDSGEIIAVAESDVTNHVVKVQRYSAAGLPQPVELTLSGYSQPALTSDGSETWLIMIRQSDGAVVSRHFSPVAGWDGSDVVEVAAGFGPYAYPNPLRQTDGRLRFILEGPGAKVDTSSVLGFQRGL